MGDHAAGLRRCCGEASTGAETGSSACGSRPASARCWRRYPASCARPSPRAIRRSTDSSRPRSPTTTTANEDYARLVGQGLVEGKLLALGELERTAHAETLTEADLGAWLGALESLRLTLGTQLDITEESYVAFDESDPDAPRLALYHWLSWLQEEVVQAMSGD